MAGETTFVQSFGDLLPLYGELIPYALVLTVGIVALIVLTIVRNRAARHKKSGLGAAGIGFGDIEQMRQQGLISEEEYRRIRQKVAARELEKTYEADRQAQEKEILAQMAQNPELAEIQARRLLPPEIAARPPGAGKTPPPRFAAPPESPATVEESGPKPSPPAKPAAPAAGPVRDIDMLLKKGAITPEEYERLKKFID